MGKILSLLIISFFLLFMFTPHPVYGEATRPSCCYITSGNIDSCDSIDYTMRGIDTALGCVPTWPPNLVSKLLTWGISLAGGTAFLFMLWAGFQYITSTGDPEKLKEAQSILTSAILGLLLVIFSVFLLKLIGGTILQIPGFLFS